MILPCTAQSGLERSSDFKQMFVSFSFILMKSVDEQQQCVYMLLIMQYNLCSSLMQVHVVWEGLMSTVWVCIFPLR